MRTIKLLALIGVMTLMATAAAQQTVLKPIGTVKLIMQTLVIPSSDAVFKAAAEPPRTPDDWVKIRNQALVLAESANLLMMNGRAPDQGDWVRFAIAQRDAAERVMQAAASKDTTALETAGNDAYESCDSCHAKYMRTIPPDGALPTAQ